MLTKNAARDMIQDISIKHGQALVQVKLPAKESFYISTIKRYMDILLALIGLLLSLPILAIFALAVCLDSKGPAFYVQERVGYAGKTFNVIKMRSMVVNAESAGAQWAVKNDPRVTKVGAFMRKTRIDELPQFINVLRGEMSIVGPRPERSKFTSQFNEEIPGFIYRLSVKPGLTGWAQVNGGYDITPREKLELDMHYIDNVSFWMDLKIMFRTLSVVITGEGAR